MPELLIFSWEAFCGSGWRSTALPKNLLVPHNPRSIESRIVSMSNAQFLLEKNNHIHIFLTFGDIAR
jgi:hypothetical protein